MGSKLLFRPKYRELSPAEQDHVDRIKDAADNMLRQLHPAGNRETALAITKLEECVMWAVKGATTE